MGSTPKYSPSPRNSPSIVSAPFWRQIFVVIMGHLQHQAHCPEWEIPQVCPIRANFDLAPQLTHSDNKLVLWCDNGSSAAPSSLTRMGNTLSMSHPCQFRLGTTSNPFWQQIESSTLCHFERREKSGNDIFEKLKNSIITHYSLLTTNWLNDA